MSRTTRKRYDGHTIRDGQHGKHCPSKNCNICETGHHKGTSNKRDRATMKRNLRNPSQ